MISRSLLELWADIPSTPAEGESSGNTKRDFLERVFAAIRKHIDDPDFNTILLSKELGYSRMHVNRRMQAILRCSTRSLIQLVRMQRAQQLLKQENLKVSSVARSVGFKSASHFSHVFKHMWGESPSHLRRSRSYPSS